MINENCNKLIIFIDELDRCNPKYAVKMLERIKHYFTDERIIIVVSTNLLELSNIVSAMYGNKFSSLAYLDKFFDVRLELPNIDIDIYMKTLDTTINVESGSWYSIAVNTFIKTYKLMPREINRYMGCLKFFEKYLREKEYFPSQRYKYLVDYLFIPYIIGLYVFDLEEYNNFKNFNGWNKFRSYILSNDSLIYFCKYSLFENNDENVAVHNEIVLDEVNKLYSLLFEKVKRDVDSAIKIGNSLVNCHAFNSIEDKLSILGSLSDFGVNN